MAGARLPMFPLGTVLFPGASMPLHVFEPRYRAMMHDCLAGDHRFGVVLIERGSEVGGGDQRAMIGTRGAITRSIELPDGRWLLQVRGETVIAVEEWLPDDPYPLALVRVREPGSEVATTLEAGGLEGGGVEREGVRRPGLEGGELVGAGLEAAMGRVRHARALLAEHGGAPPLPPDLRLDGGGDAESAIWELCAAAPLSPYDAQRLLSAESLPARVRLLVGLMDDLELDLQRMGAGE